MSNFEFLTHFKTVVVDVLNGFPIFEPLINQSLIYRTRPVQREILISVLEIFVEWAKFLLECITIM